MSRVPTASWLAPLVGFCTFASCASFLGRPAETPGGRTTKISHARHTKAKIDCIVCHEEIYDAEKLGLRYLPREDKCLECHKAEKEKGNCAFCHNDPEHPRTFAERKFSLSLSHAEHIELVEEDCSKCHSELPEPGRDARLTPPMAACMTCHVHEEDYAKGTCERCHDDLSRYALKPIADFSHSGDFVREHSGVARSAADTCLKCHEETFCLDCHAKTAPTPIEVKLPERVDRSFIHRDDFISRHALEARMDSTMCLRCHGESSCLECHETRERTPMSATGAYVHPEGWLVPGAPDSHGVEARINIVACAACHDEGPSSICIDCHRVGGVGGSPHPLSWLGRHRRDDIERNPMCLYCHL